MFDYGDLRVLVIAMLSEQPRHGYELIKAIEAQTAGSYSPSPGVIYPTLAWLEDMGYAAVDLREGGKKLYRVTADGDAFLAATQTILTDLRARLAATSASTREGVPAPITRSMENLKTALRLRVGAGDLELDAVDAIAAVLDAAARTVEQS